MECRFCRGNRSCCIVAMIEDDDDIPMVILYPGAVDEPEACVFKIRFPQHLSGYPGHGPDTLGSIAENFVTGIKTLQKSRCHWPTKAEVTAHHEYAKVLRQVLKLLRQR